jgi:hypothetical protein
VENINKMNEKAKDVYAMNQEKLKTKRSSKPEKPQMKEFSMSWKKMQK